MSEGMKSQCCSKREKERTEEEKKALIKRLRLAEGQLRGIQKMIENDAYCPDILIQVSAVTNALNSFNRELLTCHINSCLVEEIKNDDREAIELFTKMIQRLMK